MSLPGNGIFVVQGEMAMLVTAMRRSTRWGSHSFPNEEYDVLMKTFQDLKMILNQIDDLRLLDPATYLSPFLEVIRSKETTGPVTSLALSAIHKFLSYGLIDPTHPSVPATVEDIADAVTHARFVGTDHSSDGVVLMKILQVLRTLMLSPEGTMLTDESVCEIMLTCFRICFETRLTELLRRNAEQCLRDMTHLIFSRLPQYPAQAAGVMTQPLSLKKREKVKKKGQNTNSLDRKSPTAPASPTNVESDTDVDSKVETLRNSQDKNLINESEITIEPTESITKKHKRHSSMELASNGNASITQLLEKVVGGDKVEESGNEAEQQPPEPIEPPQEEIKGKEKLEEYVNHRGIRFMPEEETVNLQPYGLVYVRELFRFLISLCNPLDPQNTSSMVHLGLSLLQVCLEVGVEQLNKYPQLMQLVQDPLTRNLITLLNTERISIFALDLQVSFLLFEALRFKLKFQMEAFFKKLIEIISSDTSKAVYELKEIHHLALESLTQLFRIPGLCTELYLNYDCDIYCMNIFEDITKLLAKNVVSSTPYNIHSLSFETLMTIIEAIEISSQSQKQEMESKEKVIKFRGGHVSLELGGLEENTLYESQNNEVVKIGRHTISAQIPTEEELDNIRNLKKWVIQGTELFNQKPEKGIEFLQEHSVLKTPLDPHEVAMFLRENPELDKKMIGEYICKRSSRDEEDGQTSVLGAFADSFDYSGLRIEQALRLYLETFRLPGEAPLIFLVMERFAERWHTTNGSPFANTDAAFRLAYAVIMLNMDQHNHNAKKLNVPMTAEDFIKNLRGCNGSGDFDQVMLEQVYHSIRNEEMVMPAERTGPVRDAYLWRVLQRRGQSSRARYLPPSPAALHSLLCLATAPAVTALSAAFERAQIPEETQSQSDTQGVHFILSGAEKIANLLARPQGPLPLTLDTLLLALCKFTGLLALNNNNYIAIGVTLGQSMKCQLALRKVCSLCAKHCDCVRDAWRHLLEIVKTLYLGRLLPKCMMEAEDYLDPNGTVSLIRDSARGSEAGLLSSIYSYIALGETGMRAPTPHEKALIDAATECVAQCNLPGLLVTETKFLHIDSLQELIKSMISVGSPPDAESLQLNPQLEDIAVFFLELLVQTLIQNRDRVHLMWDTIGPHLTSILSQSPQVGGARIISAILRAVARLSRSASAAPLAIRILPGLLNLPPKTRHPELISCGLYELVKTSAQNVHSGAEWDIVFSLVCACGAGLYAHGPGGNAGASSRSEGSEEETDRLPHSASSDSELSQLSHSPHAHGWIMVPPGTARGPISSAVLSRCVEALSLVVRDAAHVTPDNCGPCVRALVTLATANTARKSVKSRTKTRHTRSRRRSSSSDDDSTEEADQYHMISLQLLDLMHTLHSRIGQIFKWWREEAEGQSAEDYDLWELAWKPLLQGIALYCTDRRKQISSSALAYLQRALLAPGLSGLGAARWQHCCADVLVPLLTNVEPSLTPRALALCCKVFLQHLSGLSSLPTFPQLWCTVVDIQRQFISPPRDDSLTEAALESLKNMVLVMDSVGIFKNGDEYNDLWHLTWEKIGEFLPNLKEELFPQAKPEQMPQQSHDKQNIFNIQQTTIQPIQPPIQPIQKAIQEKPVSGMVAIRSQLYDQPGLTSSVLLQPLNEMISTPIGIALQPQMPILVPMYDHPTKTDSQPKPNEPVLNIIEPQTNTLQNTQNIDPLQNIKPQYIETKTDPQSVQQNLEPQIVQVITDPFIPQRFNDPLTPQNSTDPQIPLINRPIDQNINKSEPQHIFEPPNIRSYPGSPQRSTLFTDLDKNIQQGELYSEYITNPYNDTKISLKEPTIYDPESQIKENILTIENKSLSENTTPLHSNKAQFGSSDNVKQESGIFNFSSYFGSEMKSGTDFDNLLSHEG